MLLAKSTKPGQPPKTLLEHSREIIEVFVTLFGQRDQPTRLCKRWLSFFRLPEDTFADFHTNGLAACGLHDLGKANDGFQDAVQRRGDQVLRHEHLSGLILLLPELSDWMQEHFDADIVLSAVLGHHLKSSPASGRDYPAVAEPMSEAGESLLVHARDPEFRDILATVATYTGIPHCTPEVPEYWSLYGDRAADHGQAIEALREKLVRRFRRFGRSLENDPGRRALLLAIKAAVIVADAAASGLARENHPIVDWLHEVFDEKRVLDGTSIDKAIIEPRIAAIEAQRRQAKPDYRFRFQDFQIAAARLPDRALLLAACGVGKTMAAWQWIQARLNECPTMRVLFLYPTRATSAEGFRDYVSYAPESDAALLTGTARYELRDMFENPEDMRSGRSYLTEERLYALGFWHKRVFSATIDQFFGFLQQNYRGLCLLPMLVDSVVVIDEVHSFDAGLYSALKVFLTHFDLPVLCMTASLPVRRREELVELGLEVFPSAPDAFEELQQIIRLPRYRVGRLDDDEQAEHKARAAVAAGRRVLWVVNTVDRCQTLARRLADLEPLCYHSRFRLNDRRTRHKSVIECFQNPDATGLIAITTQVCEMSLDLDAQVLISELAPVPSLIQRMGRCNRHARDTAAPLGEIWLYPPENERPYEKEEVQAAVEFAAELTHRDSVSQETLETLLEDHTRKTDPDPQRWISFINDGPWARGGAETLREGVDYSVPAVLSTDIEYFLKLRHRGDARAEGLILPAPRQLCESAKVDSKLGPAVRIAPAALYDERYGLCREPQTREAFIV